MPTIPTLILGCDTTSSSHIVLRAAPGARMASQSFYAVEGLAFKGA